MQTRDFVVLVYGAFHGTICGKTNLQKKVFFLAVHLGRESALGYRAHYYGPYSAAVAEANQELKSMGYLSECSTTWGGDNRGFEIARYDYSLTEDGKRLLERKKKENPDAWKEIEAFAKKMNAAGNLSYWELSIAAKAYFVLPNDGREIGPEAIQQEASKSGWRVTAEEIKNAGVFLEKVGLIEREPI